MTPGNRDRTPVLILERVGALVVGGLLLGLLVVPISAVAQDSGAEELPAAGTILEPGRYRSSAVGPHIEFRVEEGWIATGPAQGPSSPWNGSTHPVRCSR